jgi:Holliday junction resolvase RusA-like endonuclease
MAKSSAQISAQISSFEPIGFIIPGEPVAYARARPRYKPKPGAANLYFTPYRQRDFMTRIKAKAVRLMNRRKPYQGPLVLRVLVIFPWSRNRSANDRQIPGMFWKSVRPDTDNFCKLVMDACNNVVWFDDRVVVDARVMKIYGDLPGLYVHVRRAPLTLAEAMMEWDGLRQDHYKAIVIGGDHETDEPEPGAGRNEEENA